MGTVHAKNTPPPSMHTNEIPFGSGGHPCEQKRISETKTVDLKGVVARVDRVNVEGLVRTKDDVIRNSVKDLFNATNFEEMIKKAHNVRGKLANLGCFRNIAIHIDTSDGPGSTPNGYEVTYQVSELKRISGGVTTHLSNNEGILAVNVALPNILGKGESVRGEYTYGSKRSKTFNVALVKPFLTANELVGTASLFQNDMEWPMSGYKVIGRGILLDLGCYSWPKVKHNLQWEGDWRDLGVGNRYASFEIRENAGNTLKSSLRHILSYDGRDSPIFPSCGSLVKVTSEFAGVGGNVGFLKNEFGVQGNWPLFSEDFVFQLSLNLGLMNLIDDNKQPFVCDNFFLGGPLSLRGFDTRGIGPNSDGNFTGSKVYWATGAHIYTPLPFKPGSGGFGDLMRVHLFINAGNLGDFKLSDAGTMFNEQVETVRIACGLGLALRLGQMARVELNYCFPTHFQDSDSLIKGIQFGVGVNFL